MWRYIGRDVYMYYCCKYYFLLPLSLKTISFFQRFRRRARSTSLLLSTPKSQNTQDSRNLSAFDVLTILFSSSILHPRTKPNTERLEHKG